MRSKCMLITFFYLWKRVSCAALITKKHILLAFLVLRINKFVSSGYEFPSRIFFFILAQRNYKRVDGTCSEALPLIANWHNAISQAGYHLPMMKYFPFISSFQVNN
jgi:hypothetical protein